MWQALAAQAAGDFEHARDLYQQVIARVPETFDALHMLGVVCHQLGDSRQALSHIRKALELTDWRVAAMRQNLWLILDALLATSGDGRATGARGTPQHELPRFCTAGSADPRTLPMRLREDDAEPEITAVVSTYASEAFMAECLDDLISQTVFERMEVIVVDACSPENEKGIVERYQREHANIRYVRTKDRINIYAALNVAIRAARGRYITLFSTNDRLHPEAYEILADALEEHPEAQLAYGDSILTKTPHESFATHTASGRLQWNAYSYEDLLTTCLVGPHPMWRRSLHDTVGYFDEQYAALGDQEFWLRVGERYTLLHVPEVTGLYWDTEDALSKKGDLPVRELRAIRQAYERRYSSDLGEWVRRVRLAAALDRPQALFFARFGYLPNCSLGREAFDAADHTV